VSIAGREFDWEPTPVVDRRTHHEALAAPTRASTTNQRDTNRKRRQTYLERMDAKAKPAPARAERLAGIWNRTRASRREN